MRVTIVGHQIAFEDNKEFTTYTLRCKMNKVEWDVFRRYKEFDKLHKEVRQALSPAMAPSLAKLPRKIIMGNMREVNIKRRTVQLQNWVDCLVCIEEALVLPCVLDFFEIKSHLPVIHDSNVIEEEI